MSHSEEKLAEVALTILGIPVRIDATLCDEGEVWLEEPDGTAHRIHPKPDETISTDK